MTFNDNIAIDLDELIQREDRFIELTKGKPYPVLIDTTNKFIQYGRDARHHNHDQKRIEHLIKAEAFVVNSIGIKLLVKDHIKAVGNRHPIVIFDNIDDAKDWLLNMD